MSNQITKAVLIQQLGIINGDLRRRRSKLQYRLQAQNPGDGKVYWLTNENEGTNLTLRMTCRGMYDALYAMSRMLDLI